VVSNAQDGPPEAAEALTVPTVTAPVAQDLAGPVGPVRLWGDVAKGAAMPETAVNEHRNLGSHEREVWTAFYAPREHGPAGNSAVDQNHP
jgi:hypothetical protein